MDNHFEQIDVRAEAALLMEIGRSAPSSDDQIVQMFLTTCTQSPYTLRNYKNAIQLFRTFTAYRPLKDITWKDMEAFKLALARGILAKSTTAYAPATVASMLSPLRSFYKWCSDPNIGIFKHNPTTSLKSPKVQITSGLNYLTKRELALLLNELKQRGRRDYILGLMLIMLGLRVSELAGLQWEDFHPDPLETSVWLTVKKGKGGKVREVKVPATLWKQLIVYAEENGGMQPGRVFPITVRRIERIIEAARNSSALTKQVTPHWFRHTNATLALLHGASLQQVQETLGHSFMNTTQRYLHTVEQLKKAAPDFVEESIKDIL
ncbi:tyrosine-type recombinase/integrase [Paenibacillus sp. y28]|uniref:tyrosine-type recombinase/integrase n=1 Tax=Paenibacillus sp. y28 TaxID=3129110 RepID=UPI003019A542